MACISIFPYISCMFMFISRELGYDCLSLCFPHLARNGKDATAKAPRQQYPGLQQSPDAAPDQSSARCQRFLKCAKTHIYEDNVLEYSEVFRTFQNYSQHFTTIPNYPYLYHNYPDCIKHIEHSNVQTQEAPLQWLVLAWWRMHASINVGCQAKWFRSSTYPGGRLFLPAANSRLYSLYIVILCFI